MLRKQRLLADDQTNPQERQDSAEEIEVFWQVRQREEAGSKKKLGHCMQS